MSDIRKKAASTENIKVEWMKSLEGMVTLLNARTEIIALKGRSFQCGEPATEESVQKVEDDVRTLIHLEITKGKTHKLIFTSLMDIKILWKDTVLKISTFFQIRKCSLLNCCTRIRNVTGELPPPLPNHHMIDPTNPGHYRKF